MGLLCNQGHDLPEVLVLKLHPFPNGLPYLRNALRSEGHEFPVTLGILRGIGMRIDYGRVRFSLSRHELKRFGDLFYRYKRPEIIRMREYNDYPFIFEHPGNVAASYDLQNGVDEFFQKLEEVFLRGNFLSAVERIDVEYYHGKRQPVSFRAHAFELAVLAYEKRVVETALENLFRLVKKRELLFRDVFFRLLHVFNGRRRNQAPRLLRYILYFPNASGESFSSDSIQLDSCSSGVFPSFILRSIIFDLPRTSSSTNIGAPVLHPSAIASLGLASTA